MFNGNEDLQNPSQQSMIAAKQAKGFLHMIDRLPLSKAISIGNSVLANEHP